ncbi:MAG: antibiotic biosynthesis monooxygenase [Acidobacteriota bacterium]|nr:antibiotic biosynthesis monooxygenase [Acidobacteriota bacterium]
MNKIIVPFFVLLIMIAAHSAASAQEQKEVDKGMIVRMSEIEILPEFLEEYKAILQEEAEASVRLEKGVISIFPMYQKENPTQVRILEIYADRAAYESHLKTPHFQKYKTTTLKMVKTLKLVDMDGIDVPTMTRIFRKMKR